MSSSRKGHPYYKLCRSTDLETPQLQTLVDLHLEPFRRLRAN